ncbi:hypothetical protein MHI32_12170 [Paenibacillus sp. FSL H7-0690]|uniref:hypothetical protein n=1 Tax=Paenibacillus sp. FSL H7-0690 TaxID=2921437 RepID=UPI0030ECAC17
MSVRDNGAATGIGNIRTSAFDQQFSRNKELLVIVFNSWLALRLCIKYAAARHSDPDDAIGMYFAFGACFRTPETLLLSKRGISGVFRVNSCNGVRWHTKYRKIL